MFSSAGSMFITTFSYSFRHLSLAFSDFSSCSNKVSILDAIRLLFCSDCWSMVCKSDTSLLDIFVLEIAFELGSVVSKLFDFRMFSSL